MKRNWGSRSRVYPSDHQEQTLLRTGRGGSSRDLGGVGWGKGSDTPKGENVASLGMEEGGY